ncbi:MAG: hypothetical protein ACP5M0_13680 [Desulfomonilaceae bacterium]
MNSIVEERMILKLVGMIVLGLISAVLSYYNKNFYVRIFNDILGREEDEDVATRVGRGFYYGFFFPIYFVLVLAGLVTLVAFVIVIGIVAGIVFVIVWVTEKILPHEGLGKPLMNLFAAVGIAKKEEVAQPVPSYRTTDAAPPCACAEKKENSSGPAS